jgi:hypothetical protein
VFDSTRFGLELGTALEKLFPGKLQWSTTEKLVGSKAVAAAFAAGADSATVRAAAMKGVPEFKARRDAFLLY